MRTITYEPRFLREVFGQSRAKAILVGLISSASRRLGILVGPTGTGKTSMARCAGILVACERFSALQRDACGVCAGCLDFLKHPSAYVRELRGNHSLGDLHEGIRDFLSSNVKPVAVIFIDEISFLTKEALGELLEMIDASLKWREQSGQKVFVLFASTPELIGENLRSLQSRCVTLTLTNLTVNQIAHGLVEIAEQNKLLYDPEAISTIAGATEYGMRNAVNMLAMLAETGQRITEGLVRKILALPPEAEYLDIFRHLNQNVPAVHEKVSKLLEQTDAVIFRDGLLRSFAALNQIWHGVPVSRSLGEQTKEDYKEVSRGYHPVEFQIMSDALHARRFMESQNPDQIVTMLMSLSYRLSKLEFRDMTQDEREDHAILSMSAQNKRDFA